MTQQSEKKINPVLLGAKRVGSQTSLAKAMGVSKQAVSVWVKRKVPCEHVARFVEITGIPRWMVRPDMYPVDQERDVMKVATV